MVLAVPRHEDRIMPLAVALLVAWAVPILTALFFVLVGCSKKKAEPGKSTKGGGKGSDKEKGAKTPDSSVGKDGKDDAPKSVLAPRSFKPENKEELEAMQNIKGGKVRAARDNETVEDAASDWGNVKSMMDKEKEKESGK